MLFDTHVNLHAEQFEADMEDVIHRAHAAGVTRMITISDRLDRFGSVLAIARSHDRIWCTAGVHPHYADDYAELKTDDLIRLADDPKVCGVGETGLDLHYGYSNLANQEAVFRRHIEAAQQTGLPIVIHTREADDLTGDILEASFKEKAFPILLHCYTGGERLARRALELGAFFSVSGIISFKKAQDVRDVIGGLPRERIILETDCPYLAPIPHRGRRNEPAWLVDVCRAYAELRGIDPAIAAAETTDNALRLFRRVS